MLGLLHKRAIGAEIAKTDHYYLNKKLMLTQFSLFQLKDLKYDYSHANGVASRTATFKSMPNNEKFDRNNRYEMILLINSLQSLWNLYDFDDCQKVEYLIREKMPADVRTQLEVADWLVLNWNEFNLTNFAKAV